MKFLYIHQENEQVSPIKNNNVVSARLYVVIETWEVLHNHLRICYIPQASKEYGMKTALTSYSFFFVNLTTETSFS